MAQKARDKLTKLIEGYCRIESNNMNIIEGIISIIFEYHRIATWSNKFKGSSIELTESDSKAMCTGSNGESHSVRADFSIERGQIISWELESFQSSHNCYFYGVVSSENKEFNGCPRYGKIKCAFGIDDSEDTLQLGEKAVNTSYSPQIDVKWHKPSLARNEVFTLKFTADWTEKQCKLLIFYQGEKMNEHSDEYTLLLPELDDEYEWYPCATPFNTNAYCIIRYA